ncbi:fibrinogen alpha chain [Lampris incognitus]|uniref:fibrinogen alpha chain n=1 Tax=Lampris incognitus TaxID=2546036 RepID=UPI0024B4A393|nr:fibrinogen alpha chain [Lampris incognitus]
MLQKEQEVESRTRMVCERAQRYKSMAEKTMTTIIPIYNANRRVIVNKYVSELKYVEHADQLARKLRSLRKRSAALSQKLKDLQGKVQRQIKDLYQTEVDIDIKLRACSGSCHSALPFHTDHPGYKALETDLKQLAKALTQREKVAPLVHIPHIKLQPVDLGLAPSREYKTIAAVQRELLTQFEDIEQNQVVLEEVLDDSSDLEGQNLLELE